jgi:hypothetical protein
MNGLSDSITVGLILALVFGALVFYLYTRIGQIEKRVSLTENILLDLKMATENTLMAIAAPSQPHVHEFVESIQPISAPEPMQKDEVEEVNEEEYYKTVLEQAQTKPESPAHEQVQGMKVDANFEAMTLKELKDEAKRRGVKVSTNAHKKDIIDALKRQGQLSVLEPVPGSSLDGVLEEGFPVELTK